MFYRDVLFVKKPLSFINLEIT